MNVDFAPVVDRLPSQFSPQGVDEVGDLAKLRPRERARRSLQMWIEDGTLAHGQALPSEQSLADRLGVNRTTLRSALTLLREDGLIVDGEGHRKTVVAPFRGETRGAKSGALMGKTVAVFSSDREQVGPDHHQHSWSEFITQSALQSVRAANCHAMLIHPDALSMEDADHLIESKLRGVLATDNLATNIKGGESQVAATLKKFRDSGVPVVVFGDARELRGFDRVTSDHAGGSAALTQLLIQRGRQRILPIWPLSTQRYGWCAQRREGYENAVQAAGLEKLPTVWYRGTSPHYDHSSVLNQEVREVRARLMAGYLLEHLRGAQPVDALLAITDADTLSLWEACQIIGVRPDHDVDIVGYDNTWHDTFGHRVPEAAPLATVDKNNDELGTALGQLLVERLDGHLSSAPQHRTLAPQLLDLRHL